MPKFNKAHAHNMAYGQICHALKICHMLLTAESLTTVCKSDIRAARNALSLAKQEAYTFRLDQGKTVTVNHGAKK